MDAEDPIEQGAIDDGARTGYTDTDFDQGPDCGVGVRPRGIDEGEAVEFWDAVDGDYKDAIEGKSAL